MEAEQMRSHQYVMLACYSYSYADLLPYGDQRRSQTGAMEMVQNASAYGVTLRWVCGDSVYGDSPTCVQGVRDLEKWHVPARHFTGWLPSGA